MLGGPNETSGFQDLLPWDPESVGCAPRISAYPAVRVLTAKAAREARPQVKYSQMELSHYKWSTFSVLLDTTILFSEGSAPLNSHTSIVS